MAEQQKPTATAQQAAEVLERFHAQFSDVEIPVPVEAIAVDLLGLTVDEDDHIAVSGMLVPAERQILLNGRESRQSQAVDGSRWRTRSATGCARSSEGTARHTTAVPTMSASGRERRSSGKRTASPPIS